ncbi:response regulator transcription factor [Alkalibacter saccharofermentans]|uniref:Stage 0 sporulation protein A homolog n=1 Tax=Alkalibacter saccharofermentans DSM 14828 TaxID=1120975 RepID=A0A1M4ZMN2_9FIRM|nr:response regulator transcription factor [Alkalibacter saccharofermentans]SHF19185.1 DNA-binding response regulator, OmpR family, contains REC and winged-helix (wHTH) domain [Alkalibacter saccharofermentans DSM 14828]
MRVLLVEDEKPLAQAMAKIFEKNKILTDIVNDGLEGQMLAGENIYDVIVLDIMLPNVDGLEILKAIREKGKKTPVLILTAMDSTKDKVKGLNMGADDYMVKPFDTEELVARVRALARRPKEIFHDSLISFCDVSLNINTGEASIAGSPKNLTAKEAQLLEMFLRNPGMIVSKDQIIDRIWGFDSLAAENSVEIYVHYLRKKLLKSNTMIQTQRGLGYVLKERD